MKRPFCLFCCVFLLGASACPGAATVYFDQVGNDVVVTWTGTLDVSVGFQHELGVGTDNFSSEMDFVVSRSTTFPYMIDWYSGAYTTTSLAYWTFWQVHPDVVGDPIYFGFFDNTFHMVSLVGGPDYSVIDFDAGDYRAISTNTIISAIGAGSFNNTLAWTSASGDTVRFTTGSPPIPEPSSLVLFGLGVVGAALRRSR